MRGMGVQIGPKSNFSEGGVCFWIDFDLHFFEHFSSTPCPLTGNEVRSQGWGMGMDGGGGLGYVFGFILICTEGV